MQPLFESTYDSQIGEGPTMQFITQSLVENFQCLKFLVDGLNFWISFPPSATLCNSGETNIADEEGDASPRL